MRILVTGGTGQLGTALSRLAPKVHPVVALGTAKLDVRDRDIVRRRFHDHRPEVVIHAAAMTNVDGCETDPASAHRVNVGGTANVIEAAREIGARVVYISTNYVFDGEADMPYQEGDGPDPISVYGRTKLDAETIVGAEPSSVIIRTAMLYDETGRNLVNTMLRLAATQPRLVGVDDQFGNPTYAGDLAEAIFGLIETNASGIFHLVNQGVTSWYGWAREIFQVVGNPIPIDPIPANSFPRPARPPRYGALENTRAAALGIQLPAWEDGLRRCLERRAKLRDV